MEDLSENKVFMSTGFVPFLETTFQDFLGLRLFFARALKFTLTTTLPRSQC